MGHIYGHNTHLERNQKLNFRKASGNFNLLGQSYSPQRQRRGIVWVLFDVATDGETLLP